MRAIESDPDKLGGTPVVAGTRFPVYRLLCDLEFGDSVETIADDYGVPAKALNGVLQELANHFYNLTEWRKEAPDEND